MKQFIGIAAVAVVVGLTVGTEAWAQWTVTNLHPPGAGYSYAWDARDTQQVGQVEVGGRLRASLWIGTAASWVDLHPAGSTYSTLVATDGTQQVGQAELGGIYRAGLWSGTAASFVDLHPAGFDESAARDLLGTQQVGWAFGSDFVYRASLWNGTAGSWFDLSSVLTGSWGDTEASSIWSDGSTIYIAGYGFNNDTGRGEALIWTTPVPEPGTAALLGLGGLLLPRRRR